MSAADVIVLAGGFGTRLRSLVPDLPKPLAPVAGRPLLAYILDRYASAGVRRAILATGYRSEAIEQAIGSGWKGMDIVISREDTPLGTGGAIRLAARLVQGEGAFVTNGDTYLRCDLAQVEQVTRSSGAHLGMALVAVDDVARYGSVTTHDGLVTGFAEKGRGGPGLINAGTYFLTRAALGRLPVQESYSFEQDVLAPWAAAGQVAACLCGSDPAFIDIGVPEDYARAQEMFRGAS